MTVDTATSLQVSRIIPASPEEVFDAWTRPERLKLWSCPEGYTVEDAEVDLVVGGRYRIRMRSPEDEISTAVGTYRAIERPDRLEYTWQWEEDRLEIGETVVTVRFNAVGGSTEVVLDHSGFPAEEAKAAHEQGWTSCLDRLERVFE